MIQCYVAKPLFGDFQASLWGDLEFLGDSSGVCRGRS